MCYSLQQKGRNTHFIENHVISRIFINHLYGIENKPWFNFIWGGGGKRPKPPPPPPPTSTPVAPSGKVCVVTSVASFLVWGGQDPQMYRQKVFIYCASERSERAPQKHIFSGLKIHLPTYIQSMHFPLLMVWRYKRYYTDKTLKLRKKSMIMRASLENASHFHMLKLLFPSIFCWYFRYFVSETFSLYHLYDTIINDSIPTKH